MSGITLSAAMRSNLLSLQSTVKNMDMTQVRLATGREVNEAIDSPYRYFTSSLLQDRATDLDTLNHDLNLSAKTIQAGNNGMEAMLDLLDQAKALLQQSLQESDGFQRIDYLAQYNETLSQIENTAEDSGYKGKNLLGGAGNDLKAIFNEEYTSQLLVNAVDFTDIGNIGLDKNMYAGDSGVDTVTIGGTIGAQTKMVDIVSGGLNPFAVGDEIEFVGLSEGDIYGAIEITDTMTVDEFMTYVNVSVDNVEAELSATAGSIDFTYATEVAIRHLKEPNTAISGVEINAALGGMNDGILGTGAGGLFPLSPGADLNDLDGVTIASGGAITFDVDGTTAPSFVYGVDGESIQDFIDHVNNNVDGVQIFLENDGGGNVQLGMSTASSVGTLTLAAGGAPAPTLGATIPAAAATTGTVNAQGAAPVASNAVAESDFFSDSQLESLLLRVRAAELEIRQQVTSFSTDLTLIQRRMEFSEMMINTLELGATDLVIADTNEEGANMLTLQTRQQLSNTALSLAAQAEQGVLRLFG